MGKMTSEATQRMIRLEPTVEKKPQFEIDLRVEGVSQDSILQDEERMKEINEKFEKFKQGIRHKIHS